LLSGCIYCGRLPRVGCIVSTTHGTAHGGGDLPDRGRALADTAYDMLSWLGSGLEHTVSEACRRAVSLVEGCEAAGIVWTRRGGAVETLAATDALVTEVHAAQDVVGEGPWRSAVWDRSGAVIDDLTSDARWPRFAARAVQAGARSMLCLHLAVHGDTLSALTLVSRKADAFDAQARELGTVLASYVALALTGARAEDHLWQAVQSRQLIGEAVGILAHERGITTAAAFGSLTTSSQLTNVKVRELAARIVADHDSAHTTAQTTARHTEKPLMPPEASTERLG
jgi:transcriptional regulator with GAF, ATPase, and Fis domain